MTAHSGRISTELLYVVCDCRDTHAGMRVSRMHMRMLVNCRSRVHVPGPEPAPLQKS